MNSQVTTFAPITPISAKTILSKDGFTCSLMMLAPGDETPWHEPPQVEEHILYIIEGDATVRFGDVNTILQKDEALLIPKGKMHAIAAPPERWAKILRIDVPPRQVIVPQILTVDR